MRKLNLAQCHDAGGYLPRSTDSDLDSRLVAHDTDGLPPIRGLELFYHSAFIILHGALIVPF